VLAMIGFVVFVCGIVGLVRPRWLRLPNRWWAGLVVFSGLAIAGMGAEEPDPEKAARAKAQAERVARELQAEERADAAEQSRRDSIEAREERIEAGFDPWDGNHRELERIVKAALNDPDSYDHEETTYRDQGDQLWIRMRFRSRNMMGGMVRHQVMALADLDGNILEVLAHQARGADGYYQDVGP